MKINITDDMLESEFKGTNFGILNTTDQRRKYVAQAVLKRVCGYSTGGTISHIMHGLGLTKTLHGKPIKAARQWMYGVIGRDFI